MRGEENIVSRAAVVFPRFFNPSRFVLRPLSSSPALPFLLSFGLVLYTRASRAPHRRHLRLTFRLVFSFRPGAGEQRKRKDRASGDATRPASAVLRARTAPSFRSPRACPGSVAH